MKDFPLTDRKIENLCEDYCQALLDSLAVIPGEKHEFSVDFERKMELLIKKSRKRQAFKKIKHSVASIILVLVSLFSIWMIFDTEMRAEFCSWAREQYENFFVYHYFPISSSDVSVDDYMVTWLPEGYAEGQSEVTDDTVLRTYASEKGEIIIMWYISESSDTYVSLDGDVHSEPVDINGQEGHIYWSGTDNHKSIIWIDDFDGVTFCIESSEDIETVVKIANNIINIKAEG